jgi:lipopolysaccharide/colanic/teichoic acid biosynthesis glycosyltransferase
MTTRVIRHSIPFGDLLKRVFDVLAAAFGLLLLSPVFLYIAWQIKRDSPGPVFYRGLRAGLDRKTFYILKFRTMHEIAENYNGPRVTAQDDVRISSIGEWLRETKLNELPQLWNVLKGAMSLVGPRPEDPEIAAGWPVDVREEVLSVRPGITSPSSVIYRDEEKRLNGAGFMQIYLEDILPSKLRLDQLYVRYHTFWNDLDVLFYTLLILLPKLGKTSPPEESLIVGPFSNFVRRHFSWFAVDTLTTLVAISLVGLLWRSFGPLHVGWLTALIFGVLFALIFSFTSALFGLQKTYWSRSSGTQALDLLPPVMIGTVILLLINLFVLMRDPQDPYQVVISIPNFQPLFPISMILLAAALSLIGFVLVRYRSRFITGLATRWMNMRGKAPAAQERALIVGSGETGQYVSLLFSAGTYQELMKIVGFVDDDFYKLDSRIQGINVIGRCRDIPELVSKYDIGIIIYAIHNITYKARGEILDLCYKTPARTVFFPDIPATLSAIVYRDNGLKDGKTQTSNQNLVPSSLNSDLPCHICLSKLSPPQVNAWLDQLEHTANQGDMELVLNQLQNIRKKINDETSK